MRSLWKVFRGINSHENRWVLIGVLGVVISLIGGAGFYAATLPWSGTADANLHLDYAWQVSHGQLPSFWDGTKIPVGRSSKIQFVSQHPPLYYAVLAPAVRSPVDSGDLSQAVLNARLITIGIAVLCVFAFSFAGWSLGGNYRSIMAVAFPAVGTSLVPFIKISGDIMNDSLVILTTTLALTLSSIIIKKGLERKYLLGLTSVCVLGMSSKATFVGAFALSLLSVLIASYIYAEKKRKLKSLLKGFGMVTIIALIVLAGIGWFYFRNWEASGLWYRSGPQSWAAEYQNRRYKSLSEVLTNPKLLSLLPSYLYGNPWTGMPKYFNIIVNFIFSRILFFGAGFSLVIASIKWKVWRNRDVRLWGVVGILIAHSALIFVEQITHAIGYGAINMRYMLALWLPLTAFLTVGIASVRKLRGLGVVAICIVNWTAVIVNSIWFINTRYRKLSSIEDPWSHLVYVFTEKNEIPYFILPFLLVCIVAGISFVTISLWKLSSSNVEA